MYLGNIYINLWGKKYVCRKKRRNGGIMKLRKAMVLLIAMLVTVGLFWGCSKKETENQTSVETKKPNETKGTTNKDEIVTLKWIQVGNGMPTNYEAWQKHINEYLGEKIGVHIEVEVVPWSDWDNRRNVIVNSGEYFDILFTDSSKYSSQVNMGAFLDITDLIEKNAAELVSYIPKNYWDAVSVKGKIYSVPTYKDSSCTEYMVWDKVMTDKYQIDYDNIRTFEELEAALAKIKEGEGKNPFIMDKNGVDAVLVYYDQMGVGLPALGVRYDDTTRKVVNVLEQEDVLKQLDMLHKFYKAGIISPDAPTLDEAPKYRTLQIAQGWSAAAKTTWGPNMGSEAVAVQYTDTIVSNTTVRGSLSGIYSGTKYPEKCLQFLQLVNLDSVVRDAFYYGLEGENFKYNEKGEVERINNDWSMAGYTQGTFFNVTKLAGDDSNQWEEVKTLNGGAKPSVLLGFNLDTSNIETELANCRAVYEKYKSELLTGAKEPRELVKTITKELYAAGFETIVKETQDQIDAKK